MSYTCYERLLFTNEEDAKKIFDQYFDVNDTENPGKKVFNEDKFFGEDFGELDYYQRCGVRGAGTQISNASIGEPWKDHAFYDPTYTHEIHAESMNGDARQILFQIMAEHPEMQMCASVRDHGDANEVVLEQIPTADKNKTVTYKKQFLGELDFDTLEKIPPNETVAWSISHDELCESIQSAFGSTAKMRNNVLRAKKAEATLESVKPTEATITEEKSLGE